ncbi:hypothetical protein J2Y55_003084 [Bosea sp. BE125]|uniref:hypothetical protein n=1 Tax=Bosea sp. BE125 TaxID=2817909 RepID=UPI00285A08FB|nr:hypothetical protein [Bosea sp. BE125]MDR6872068.1 hypothetical protein [Bosea sp. BE125]
MAIVVSTRSIVSPVFPATDVAAVLRDELLSRVRSRYRRKGVPLPKADKDVVIKTIDIDSLTVVEILSSLDDLLPFPVTESVVRSGGYNSITDAVEHVTGRIEKRWKTHHGGEHR